MSEPIGIIGVGELAAALTEGISGGGPDVPPIHLSPRNSQVSARLADTFDHVQVCADNQAVVDSSAVVILAVRPDVTGAVLEELSIPSDRLVISAVAGWSCRALRDHIDGRPDLVRSIPLPAVRRREGVTALYPGHPVAEQLFEGLGGTLVTPTEDAFAALSATTATLSSHLQYLSTIATWLGSHGLGEGGAEQFVRSLFRGVSNSLGDSERSLPELRHAHETPGGINEQLRLTWFDSQNEAGLAGALDEIYRRVTGSPA